MDRVGQTPLKVAERSGQTKKQKLEMDMILQTLLKQRRGEGGRGQGTNWR